MSGRFTRRGFLGSATTASVVSKLAPALALPDTPQRPRMSSFDEGWNFSRDGFPGAEKPDFADDAWRHVDVPHDWSIEGPYSKDEPAGGSGGYLPTGVGWYRKHFSLPPAARGKRVRIRFDGVYQRSEVWINGISLGMRPYGYIGFTYDLTPHLRSDGDNVVAVRVDNSLQPNSRWYSGSGIYRHVWLIVTEAVHIADWGVQVRAGSAGPVNVAVRAANQGDDARSVLLETDIVDRDGKIVGTASTRGRVAPGSEKTLEQTIPVVSPRLWSTATPYLYTANTRLNTGDGVPDSLATQFGIRDAIFDADNGFVLNGERVKLNGVCVHGDGGAVGTAVAERIWERRLDLLKEMGCNAIRCSHNPPAPEFLDLCDRKGLLVMAEAFDEWHQPKAQTPDFGYHRYFDAWAGRDLADMIARDRNHPCIVLWSAGNEVPDQTDPKGPQTLQNLLDIFHTMDPTRPVTVACDNIAAEPKAALPEFLDKLDVVGYNYVDRWRDRREKFYSIDRHDYPRRKFVGTESPAMGGSRGSFRLGDEPPVFGERPGNTRIEVEQLQKFVQTYDYVSGDFMWTGIDYLGESFWPGKSASSGVLDTCGFPKDGYYFYQSLWTAKPVLHLFPHWNWRGREGETVAVACYTNCDTVELFLNAKSLGTKGFAFPRPGMTKQWGTYPPRALAPQTTADLHLSWDVAFAPGTLKAVGMKDGQPVAVAEIRTTGAPAAIRLVADRDRFSAGRSDLAHVTASLVDRDGLVVPTAENEIVFRLTGTGKIIGLDNGRPDSHENYRGDTRKAFGGLALALVQSAKPGVMLLSASSSGLTPAEIQLGAS